MCHQGLPVHHYNSAWYPPPMKVLVHGDVSVTEEYWCSVNKENELIKLTILYNYILQTCLH